MSPKITVRVCFFFFSFLCLFVRLFVYILSDDRFSLFFFFRSLLFQFYCLNFILTKIITHIRDEDWTISLIVDVIFVVHHQNERPDEIRNFERYFEKDLENVQAKEGVRRRSAHCIEVEFRETKQERID